MTGSGAAGSCRRPTRGSSSVPSAIRCSFSRTRAGSPRPLDAGCSTTSPGSMSSITASSAIPKSSRASPSTRWRIACKARSPSWSTSRESPSGSSTCTVPNRERPGTFAANCLLARRLAERGVRFIQLFHRGWDQHTHLPSQIAGQCRDTDQPSAALVRDLEAARAARRHAGCLGRRVRTDGLLPGDALRHRLRTRPPPALLHRLDGRRRHQAGHQSRRRPTIISYNILEHPVHVHDLHATILHCLGIDHTRLTFKYQGRHHRLTDVHGTVVRDVLA